jgi:beta-glucosidase-like glycosyl hydrolase
MAIGSGYKLRRGARPTRRRAGPGFRASLILLLTIVSVAALRNAFPSTAQGHLSSEEIARFVHGLDLETLLGQVLMVGVQAGEDSELANRRLEELIQTYKLGGVILFEGNFPPQYRVTAQASAQSVADLTRALQTTAFRSQSAGQKIPLLTAMDEEGGSNMVIGVGVTRIPSPIFLGGARSEPLARQAGFVIGREMKALGVNTVLAPVADVNNNSKNDIIGKRAFGAHPDIVSPLSAAFARGLQQAAILSVAKHFPGHGTSADDPHFVLPQLGYEALDDLEHDLKPFQALIDAGVDGIMTAHIMAHPLDRAFPVTISRNAVNDRLRQRMRFNGLVLTDDISEMMGILLDENRRIVRDRATVAIRALEAGNDVVIFAQLWLQKDRRFPERSVTPEDFREIHRRLQDYFSEQDKRPVLERAVTHVLAAKARLVPWERFHDFPALQPTWSWDSYQRILAEDQTVAEEIVRRSAVLISEDGSTINNLGQSNYFRLGSPVSSGQGPLSIDVLLHSDERATVVDPAFRPPGELYDEIRKGWLPATQIEHVPLVYGWRTQEKLREASKIWGFPVKRLSRFNATGQRDFDLPEIRNAADEIIRISRNSRVIVFGVLLREEALVLEEVCRRLLPERNKEIVVVLFLEPYFLAPDVYRQKNVVVLSVSALPEIRLGVNFLTGKWAPQDVSHLAVTIPSIVDRTASLGAQIERDPTLTPPPPPPPPPQPRRLPHISRLALVAIGATAALLVLTIIPYWVFELRKLGFEQLGHWILSLLTICALALWIVGRLGVELAIPVIAAAVPADILILAGAKKKARPQTTAEVEPERIDDTLFLVVKNRSEMASFWATTNHTAGHMTGWPAGEVFVKWDDQEPIKAEIQRLSPRRLVAGRLENDSRTGGGLWYVPFISDQGTGEARAEFAFLYGQNEGNTVEGSAVEFCITVHADPDLVSGPIVKYVRLAGNSSRVSGQPIGQV